MKRCLGLIRLVSAVVGYFLRSLYYYAIPFLAQISNACILVCACCTKLLRERFYLLVVLPMVHADGVESYQSNRLSQPHPRKDRAHAACSETAISRQHTSALPATVSGNTVELNRWRRSICPLVFCWCKVMC